MIYVNEYLIYTQIYDKNNKDNHKKKGDTFDVNRKKKEIILNLS